MTEGEPPGSDWDDHAEGWDRNEAVHAYAASTFALLEAEILSRFEDVAAIRVLDFGCGTGILSARIAALCRHVVAVDTSAKMIEVLKARIAAGPIGNITAIVATIDADSIGRPEIAGPFDLIVASSVCSFLPDYETTLQDLSMLLKPAGHFVQWDWISPDGAEGFGLPKARVRSAYARCGLIGINVEEVFSIQGADGPMPVLMGVASRPGN